MWCVSYVWVGNVAALRQAVPGDQVGGQEAPGMGGYLELSPDVNLRHEDSVQVSFHSFSPGHHVSCRVIDTQEWPW